MLQIGESAPLTITLFNQNGEKASLRDLLGKPVVLYFYPKDDTPGCTKEACEFRDHNEELEKLGVQVVGVSADSVKSHAQFTEKYQLSFPLWSDPEKKLIQAFGVLVEKSMFGKKYMGIARSTFILDENGKIIQVWSKVDPKEHAQEVLEFFTKKNNKHL